MSIRQIAAACTIFLVYFNLSAARGQDDARPQLAKQAEQFLRKYCHQCHGPAGEGGFDYILNRDKLIGPYVTLGDPDSSDLFTRVRDGEMPEQDPRPNEDEIETLRKWISNGAPNFAAPLQREFISNSAVTDFILSDLRSLTDKQQPLTRYFTITHLYNANFSDDEIQSYRIALAKLINSLSWNARLIAPRPIDPAATVLRIDLRDLKWTPHVWDQIVAANPYRATIDRKAAIAFRELAETTVPHVRGDWFVFAASRPPLYHDVLQLPKTVKLLEERLGVDADDNIDDERVARAGFTSSGVSQNNRVIERHDSLFGAYWKSYDFAGSADNKNVIEFPLGPGSGSRAISRFSSRHRYTFEPDGGEMIFNLPNGLQAYYLADDDGKRIDEGPVAIVSDPKQADRTVRNGISCMTCHFHGIIEKSDEVRDNVLANREAYRNANEILALYPEPGALEELMQGDRRRFSLAVADERIGIKRPTKDSEPIYNMSKRFESALDGALAAAECGFEFDEFQRRIQAVVKEDDDFARTLGPLQRKEGVIKRDVFETEFEEFVEALREVEIAVLDEPALDEIVERLTLKHFPVSRGQSLRAIALSPDARLLASGGSDPQVKIWDTQSGGLLKTLAATDENGGDVQALAFSPEGATLAVARRNSLAMFRVESWQPVAPTRTPSDKFTTFASIAYSPRGDQLAFAGAFQAAEVWPLAGQSEPVLMDVKVDTRTRRRPPRLVTSLSFGAGGETLAGAVGYEVKLWSAAKGEEKRALLGHEASVAAVDFSDDGKRLASGDKAGTIYLWNAETGRREFVLCTQGSRPVWSLDFSPNGNLLATGLDKGRVTIWSVFTGQRKITLTPHSVLNPVIAAIFSHDGKMLATASEDGEVHLWSLSD